MTNFGTPIDRDTYSVLLSRLNFTQSLRRQIEDIKCNTMRSESSRNEDIKNIRDTVPSSNVREGSVRLGNKYFCLHSFVEASGGADGPLNLKSLLGTETETIDGRSYQKCEVCGRKVNISLDPKQTEDDLNRAIAIFDNALLVAPLSSSSYRLSSRNINYLLQTRDALVSASKNIILPVYELLSNVERANISNTYGNMSAYPTPDGYNLFGNY